MGCQVGRSMSLSIGAVYCAEACALDRSGSFHRPAAGESLFHCGKSNQKRLAPGRTQAQLLLRLCPALLAECGPAPTRASMPSNSGALLPHSAAMLGVLYCGLAHLRSDESIFGERGCLEV